MPTYVIQTPSGRKVKIEATDEQTAMNGAMQWHDDVDAVVRTTYGEAANDPDSQAGVASVILNRAAGTGKAPRDVVMAEKQFEPWGNAKARARMEALDPGSPQYQDILNRVMPVINGEDPTGGATHFYAPTTQADMGRKPPRWDDGTGVDMGQHRFFKRPGEYGAPSDGPAVSVEVAGRPELGRGEYTPPQRQTPPTGRSGPPAGAPRKPGVGQELAGDFKSGFGEAWGQGERALTNYYNATLRGDMMAPVNLAGDALTAASAPLAGVARAAAGQLSKLPTFDNSVLRNPFNAPRKLDQAEAKGALEGDIMTALSAAAPSRGRMPARPRPIPLGELQAQRTAAYQAVDQAGVQFRPQAIDDLVTTVGRDLQAAQIDADLHPLATRVYARMAERRNEPMTLTQLDQMRQFVRDNVSGAQSRGEQRLGRRMIQAIDNFIDNAGLAQVQGGDPATAAGLIRQARELNTRVRKFEDIDHAVEAAQLRAASTGSGGNADNAIRQNLRRFIDPTNNRRMRNLTPQETQALDRVVRGGPGQNLLRLAGKLSPSGNGLMAALNIGATAANPAMGAVGLGGILAKTAADGQTLRNVRRLTDLVSLGGARPPPPRLPPTTATPRVPLLSAPGAVGAGVTSSPLQRILADEEVRRRAKAARSATRKK